MISRHICGPEGDSPPAWNHETHRCHAADLIQSQPQELLVAALGHQLEGRLLQAGVRTLEHQASDVSDTLNGDEGMQDKRGKGTEEGNAEG